MIAPPRDIETTVQVALLHARGHSSVVIGRKLKIGTRRAGDAIRVLTRLNRRYIEAPYGGSATNCRVYSQRLKLIEALVEAGVTDRVVRLPVRGTPGRLQNQVYRIVFAFPDTPVAREHLGGHRHRRDPDDPWKTMCGRDLLDPRFKIVVAHGKGKCPKCIERSPRPGVGGGANFILTAQQQADVCRRYTDGETLASIAAVYFTQKSTIRNYLKRNGMTVRKRGGSKPQDPEIFERELRQIKRMYYDEDRSLDEIGKLMHMAAATVLYRMVKAGLPRRDPSTAAYKARDTRLEREWEERLRARGVTTMRSAA